MRSYSGSGGLEGVERVIVMKTFHPDQFDDLRISEWVQLHGEPARVVCKISGHQSKFRTIEFQYKDHRRATVECPPKCPPKCECGLDPYELLIAACKTDNAKLVADCIDMIIRERCKCSHGKGKR